MPNLSPARIHAALDALLLDVRHALRALLRDRSVTLTAAPPANGMWIATRRNPSKHA